MSMFEDLVIEKLDKLSDNVTDLKVVNAEQSKDIKQNTKDLSEHMRRTDLLEKSLNIQKKATNQRFNKLEEPRKFMKIGKKYFLILGSLAGSMYALFRLWPYIKDLF